MTLLTDLRTATDRIQAARRELEVAEIKRVNARFDHDRLTDELDITRRALMSRAEAGTNDTARRAYADRETERERDRLRFAAAELADRENYVISATSTLRIAEDERRYLELLARLSIADAADTVPVPASANGYAEEEFSF